MHCLIGDIGMGIGIGISIVTGDRTEGLRFY
jgi:hypothetical protein